MNIYERCCEIVAEVGEYYAVRELRGSRTV